MSDVKFSRIFNPPNGEECQYIFTQKTPVLGVDFDVVVRQLPESILAEAIIDGLPDSEGIEETTGLPLEELWTAYRSTPSFIKTGPINV